jgi:ubiquinone/menaquinone biosynthesis C-methylase UbiE
MVGVDLSSQMVEQAKQLSPQIDFRQGDMRSLDVPPHSWAAIVAFYSIIHIPRDQVVDVLREFRRVLQPGGLLLLAFHIGDQVIHRDEWWGHRVCVDFVFFTSDEMSGYLGTVGFTVEEVLERDPYAPEVEHQSRRAYVLARVSRNDDKEAA